MGQAQSSTPVKNQGLALIVRTCWMLWGYLPLLFFAKTIIYGKQGLFSLVDLGVLINLLVILIVRYLDIRYFEGKTGEGVPATMADFRSFALMATGFFIFMWGMLHYLAY